MIGHTRHMELYEMVSIVLTLKSSHMYHIKTLHHHHCGLNQDVVLLCPSGHLPGCFLSSILDIIFSSNHNIHKSSCGLCFWASDPLIDRFYLDLSIIGSEAQKQS